MINKHHIFWERVDIRTEDECWLWAGYKAPRGYGMLRNGSSGLKLDTEIVYAHRVAYILEKGEIPSDLVVMHTCDNTSCCNPKHLKAGTHTQNAADAHRKHRKKLANGDEINTSPENKALIIKCFNSGINKKEISKLSTMNLNILQLEAILKSQQRYI